MAKKYKISVIGAGNVATHLCRAFHKKDIQIIQVFSRNISNAAILANTCRAEAINDLSAVHGNADLYIIAVVDDAIESVSKALYNAGEIKQKLVVHSSGFSSSKCLSKFKNYGVFWPLQSFSKKDKVKFKNLPICIHANSNKNIQKIETLARYLSNKVSIVNDEQRAYLHIAAVFANNFTNHMFTIAHELVQQHNMDFDLLLPLISKTLDKVHEKNPRDMQTGPAKRKDIDVISKQMKRLEDQKDYQELYKLISRNIMND